MNATDYIDVPEILGAGDYVLRNRGDKRAPAIMDGDLLIVREQATAAVGQLVIADAGDGRVVLCEYEPGVTVKGLVTGLMRRLEERSGA